MSRRSRNGGGRPLAAILLLLLFLSLAQAAEAPSPAQGSPCPRCGYITDAAWRYCPACGWDLRVLAGAGGAAKLQSIGAGVVGLILVQEPPSLEEILPPDLYRLTRRYSYYMNRHKNFATAFPFLKPGLFVTSARALEWVEVVDVRTLNNRIVPGQILGFDLATGVGVIQAEVPGAVPLQVSEKAPNDSDVTWGICYPVAQTETRAEYLPESFHRGRISAVGIEGANLVAFESLLRTDHSLEDGCDGGPLLDAYGSLAGMVLGHPDPGISYALPASDLKALVELLAAKKKPERPFFGLALVTPDDRRRAKFHLPQDSTRPVVAYLIPDSPAARAGVKPGDSLAAIAGEKVSTVADARGLLLRAVPSGAPVTLTMAREGKEIPVSITAASRPLRILMSPSDEIQETLQANLVEVDTGPTSQHGLRVANLVRGGRGEKGGYREGDLIISAYGKGVRHLETLDQIVRESNSQVFGKKAASDEGHRFSTYRILLGVRSAEKGEKEDRAYFNYFPDTLSAPVY